MSKYFIALIAVTVLVGGYSVADASMSCKSKNPAVETECIAKRVLMEREIPVGYLAYKASGCKYVVAQAADRSLGFALMERIKGKIPSVGGQLFGETSAFAKLGTAVFDGKFVVNVEQAGLSPEAAAQAYVAACAK